MICRILHTYDARCTPSRSGAVTIALRRGILFLEPLTVALEHGTTCDESVTASPPLKEKAISRKPANDKRMNPFIICMG